LASYRSDRWLLFLQNKKDELMNNKIDFLSMDLEETQDLIAELGLPKFRAKQIHEWASKGVSISQMLNLPKAMRDQLESSFYVSQLITQAHQISKDGTEKFLFAFEDGQTAECVLMRYHHGNSACISTQIGCRMGCAFCASTRNGLIRCLSPGEMLGEVLAITRESKERVDSIVLMGTGEPLDNMENVIKFIHLLTSPDGLNLGARHISLSTCGLCPKIDELAKLQLQITLSVSLHAPNNEKRSQLMPVNRSYPIEELIETFRRYYRATNRRISFEYAMIRHFNDTQKDAEALAGLLHDMNAHVNLIPLNHVKESPFEPSTHTDLLAFVDTLTHNGINVTVRRRLGSDIDAACGQLRANHLIKDQ